jgi:hypothetical protein
MGTLDYQRRVRAKSVAASDDNWLPQIIAPAIMFFVGMGIIAWDAFADIGGRGAMFVLGIVMVIIAVNVVLGIVAAYVVVSLTGASFGEMRTAVVKLAGIITLSSALSMVIPFGGLLVLFIYLGLLIWMFEIEFGEAIIFAIVLAVVRFGVYVLLLRALF